MSQQVDRNFFLWGDRRLSANSKGTENYRFEREALPYMPAESRVRSTYPGQAGGGVEIPTYSLEVDTAGLVAAVDSKTVMPYTEHLSTTPGTFARMHLAHARADMAGYPDGLGVDRFVLVWEAEERIGSASGRVMHDDYGGVGQTATFNGASVTFPAVASGEAMRIHFHAWSVTGGPGLYDGLFESDADNTYASATTQWTLTQINSANLPSVGQYTTIEGPVTDVEWRHRCTAISAGTWFIAASAQILK